MQASIVVGDDGIGKARADREIGLAEALREEIAGADFTTRFLIVG